VIVVGVDGSEGSGEALRLAAAEAALRGAKLRIVCAWEIPATVYAGAWGMAADQSSGFEERAREVAAEAGAEVARTEPSVDWECRAVHGQAADVLARESRGCELLVVGSRGRGGFKSLVLGSVSLQVVHHATCPVMIAPHPPAAAGAREGS
jgi:nucleotide-binding universal stress UspA family protein